MPQVQRTIRIESSVNRGWNEIREYVGKSMNTIVNELLAQFVRDEILRLERDMEASARKLRAYRLKFEDFHDAKQAVAEAEAKLESDPAEGVPFDTRKGVDEYSADMASLLG